MQMTKKKERKKKKKKKKKRKNNNIGLTYLYTVKLQWLNDSFTMADSNSFLTA